MRYTNRPSKRRWPRRIIGLLLAVVVLVVGATAGVRMIYDNNLKPVSASQKTQEVVIKKGATDVQIGKLLEEKKLIRSAWAFRLYVSSKEVRGSLQAGTYEIAPSQSVPEIVSQLTHGKIVTNLITILPGQRLDQIKRHLVQSGFDESAVTAALDPAQYVGNSALVDKPASASLEGYIYPESYQRTAETSPRTIVAAALAEMDKKLTPELRNSFAKQGLSTYQGIVLASIVEKEVSSQADRNQAAQVFIKRLRTGMRLESNVTSSYGAILDGAKPSSSYPSIYNTYLHEGLPPAPVGNVSLSSLKAVANPAETDWLYFVAGDDGITYFSTNLSDHEAKVKQYCSKLCGN